VFRAPEVEDDLITALAVEPGVPARPRTPAPDLDTPPPVRPRSVARPAASKGGGLALALGLTLGGVALVVLCGGGLTALLVVGFYQGRAADGGQVADAAKAVQPAAAEQKLADAAQPKQPPDQQRVQQAPPQAAQQPPAANPPAQKEAQAPPPQQQQAQAAPLPAGPPVEPIHPLDPGAQPAGATTIPVEVLRDLKAATVFIKVDAAGDYHATGSGFLVRAQGDSGYVVTNHHVITVSPDDDDDPAPRRGPFLRPRFVRPRPAGPATITLVFWSGTPQEKSTGAEVLADDDTVDLALLRFRGIKDPPHPIDPRQQPQLVETMPVFALGFPFGELLDPKKGNPAITVANSTVSSLRLDERGELAKVQVAGGLNPGNSGGPMVDARGRLVGVAVAKVRGAEIGLAIPAQQVTKLLGGRVANPSVAPLKTENGVSTIQVEARVLDPLQQLRSVAVYYLRGNMGAQAKADLTAQAGVQKADLRVNGPKATAQLSLPVQPDPSYSFQVAYVGGDGQTYLTQPLAYRLGAPAVAVGPNPPAGQPGAAPAAPPPEKKLLTDAEVAEVLNELQADPQARQTGLRRLAGALPPKERRADVIKALEVLLKDPGWPTHNAAVEALVVWGGKEDAPLILPLVQAADWPTYGAALQGLAKLGARVNTAGERRADVAKALEPLLKDADGGKRRGAVNALAAWGGKEDVPLLMPMLNDADVFTRGAVFEALAKLKDPSCAEAVAEHLVPFGERGNAAKVLRALGPGGEKATLKYLNHDDWGVRLEVCKILQEIGTKESVADLEKRVAEGGLVGPAAQAALNAIKARG
jgi:S1-C subfamily serine protease/HEAT repeat protein